MITRHDTVELDDDPLRLDRDAVWRYLSTQAYWGRWRNRDQVALIGSRSPGVIATTGATAAQVRLPHRSR